MSPLPTRLAIAVAADLRIPTLGEATTLSTMPDSVSWGAAMASDGNATFVTFSESAGGIMFQRIGATGTEFASQLSVRAWHRPPRRRAE